MFYNKIEQLNNIIVFDIETTPDISLASELCEGMSKNSTEKYTKDEIEKLSKIEKRELMERYHIEKHNGNSFLRQPFHKIVCISVLVAGIERNEDKEEYVFKALKSYNSFENTEEEIVKKFWDLLKERRPRIISFNGYRFDMNVLKCKALKYGIDCGWYFNYGGKWDGWESRCSNIANYDIELENFGDYTLHEICIMLGIPCKLGIDGTKVSSFVDYGKYKEICEYCETDVLATYLVYLRMALTKGYILKEEYNKNIAKMEEYLISKQDENKGLKEFLEAWYRLNTNILKLI